MRGFFWGYRRTLGLATPSGSVVIDHARNDHDAAVDSDRATACRLVRDGQGVPVFVLRGVEVRRGERTILDVPIFSVWRGEVMAIIGPNGAGKSTLLQIMALLQRPSSGQVSFTGKLVHYNGDLLACRRRMAVVFQEPLLLDDSVRENVAAGLKMRGVDKRERDRRVDEWLRRLDIQGLAHRSARTLSGGEAQRTSLARALVLQPDVLLLDEPFGALDAPSRAALLDDLDKILRETNVTTILVTHDRGEALALGDRIAVLIDGRIRQLDTPENVFSYPATEEVATFVGVETIVSGTVVKVVDGLATVQVGGVQVHVARHLREGQKVLLCIRPEHVTLAGPDASSRNSARNALAGTVVRTTLLGTQYRVVVDCGFQLVAVITRQSMHEMDLSNGAPVQAVVKATAVHVIPRD